MDIPKVTEAFLGDIPIIPWWKQNCKGSGEGLSSFKLGTGNGYGRDYDNGYGCGEGRGCGRGFYHQISKKGRGFGWGSSTLHGQTNLINITKFEGTKVYNIDKVSTIITAVHGNIAQGFILNLDLTLTPCYIVKKNGRFAHGETLHEAKGMLLAKLYNLKPESERIKAFKKRFPKYNVPYSNADLFNYHHILTGSCKLGRLAFMRSHNLSLKGTTTVEDFIKLTIDAYGGNVIRRLRKAYHPLKSSKS